ncbi:MAG: AMP-binding protein, partial [Gammaproteobacteria bacterium]
MMAQITDIAALEASHPETFHDVLRFWADRSPDAPALMSETAEPLSYAELLRVIGDVGAALNGRGFGRGDRIAIVHPGGIDLAAALVALWSHSTVIPLGPKLRLGEYAMYLRDIRADAIVIPAGMDTPARVAAEQLHLPILTLTRQTTDETGRIQLE